VGRDNVRVLSLLGPNSGGFETPFDTTWHGKIGAANAPDRARFILQSFKHAAIWRPDLIICGHVNFGPLVTAAEHVVTEAMHHTRPTVIWDCADLDRFRPGGPPNFYERYGLPLLKGNRVVLTLGRLSRTARHKGYDRLLESWNEVATMRIGCVISRVSSA
jgi:glycosyltransferase involved in cell wall biosynthesis